MSTQMDDSDFIPYMTHSLNRALGCGNRWQVEREARRGWVGSLHFYAPVPGTRPDKALIDKIAQEAGDTHVALGHKTDKKGRSIQVLELHARTNDAFERLVGSFDPVHIRMQLQRYWRHVELAAQSGEYDERNQPLSMEALIQQRTKAERMDPDSRLSRDIAAELDVLTDYSVVLQKAIQQYRWAAKASAASHSTERDLRPRPQGPWSDPRLLAPRAGTNPQAR